MQKLKRNSIDFEEVKEQEQLLIGLLRTIGERYIAKGKEVYEALVDLENAFVRFNSKI